MKHLKDFVFESLDKICDYSSSIIRSLKVENPIIEDVEDIMVEVIDSWGTKIIPYYHLIDMTNPQKQQQHFVDLTTNDILDYFGMSEGDYDDPESDYKWVVDFIDDIRKGKKKNLVLSIDFQYANDDNGFKPLKQTDEQKEILSDVEERLKSIGCEVEYEWSPAGSSIGEGLWKLTVTVPIKFQPGKIISNLDGFSNKFIKDFHQFINEYDIDREGQIKLSNLIRGLR